MAYVLGFFAADGYLTVNKRGGQFWSIQIKDKDLLDQIKKIVGSDHKIGVRAKKGKENTVYRLQIGSIEMCDDLRSFGYRENKTKSMSVPFVPSKYFPDFVRGYFDGDGNVWVGFLNKKRNKPTFVISTEFTSCSENFLNAIKKGLEKYGIIGGCLICQKGCFKLKYSINNSKAICSLMYGDEGRPFLYLLRKKIVFENYLKECGGSSTG